MNVRRFARASAWGVAGLMLLLIAMYLLLLAINWRDEPASADVERFEQVHAQRLKVAHEQNAFVHLLGIAAALGEDPIALGSARMSYLESFASGNATSFKMPGREVDVSASRTAAITELSNTCGEVSKACAELLQADAARVEQWLMSEDWLLSRYQTLIAQPHWLESIPHDYRMPLPAYQHLMNGQKLQLLQAWQAGRNGDATQVQALLEADMRFWRNVMASSDLLISKMIAAAGARRNLGLGNLALRELPIERAASAIPPSWRDPIRKEERSMLRALAGEWRFSQSVLQASSDPNGSFSAVGYQPAPLDFLARPLLQPQATSNLFAGRMASIAELSTRPYEELARTLCSASSDPSERSNPLYNPAGRIIYSIGAAAKYDHYISRISDLEGARRMALLAAQIRRDAVPAAEIARVASQSQLRDPYSGAAFRWDAEQGAFVYEGLEVGSNYRHVILL